MKKLFTICLSLFLFTAGYAAEVFEDFEDGTTKSSYNVGDIELASGTWEIAGVINQQGSDHVNGTQGLRFRGNATDNHYIAMQFDKTGGIGTVSFKYASFGTHSGGVIQVQYSVDGTTWIDAGEAIEVPLYDGNLLNASIAINNQDAKRIKIYKEAAAGSTSVNIDDILITDYGVAVALAPTFSPAGGTYYEPVEVTISCDTEGAIIRYTTDGEDPTESSPVYSAPFTLTTNTTVKAKAWADEMEASTVSSVVYYIYEISGGDGDVFEDFESGTTKTSYNYGEVQLPSGMWGVAGVINQQGSDHVNGTQGLRLRGNATDDHYIETLFDKEDGIGTVSFKYASFSNHSDGVIQVQYSVDGTTWVNAGEEIEVPLYEDVLLEASVQINNKDAKRIKIKKLAAEGNTSVNIDDILITKYDDGSSIASENINKVEAYITDGILNVTNVSENALIQVYDIAGKLVISKELHRGIQITQKGIYLVKVSSNGDASTFKVANR